jgi:hypothetical protein
MKYFTQSVTLLGTVTVVNPDPGYPPSSPSGDRTISELPDKFPWHAPHRGKERECLRKNWKALPPTFLVLRFLH